MKKLLILFAICLCSLSAVAQFEMKLEAQAVAARMYYEGKGWGEWSDWTPTYKVPVRLVLREDGTGEVKISSRKKQYYKLESVDRTSRIGDVAWTVYYAKDGFGVTCAIKIHVDLDREDIHLYIMYQDVCFVYSLVEPYLEG